MRKSVRPRHFLDPHRLVKVVTIGTDSSREEVSYVNGEIGIALAKPTLSNGLDKKTMELPDGTHEVTSYLNGNIGKMVETLSG